MEYPEDSLVLAPSCDACPLSLTRKRVVWGQGQIPTRVMFIAEAPGDKEDSWGVPFVPHARAGQLFMQLLDTLVGIPRARVFVTNLIKCHPPNNRDPKPDEAAACQKWLLTELMEVQPELIVTLGRFATRAILGDVDMEQVHGIPLTITSASPLPAHFHGLRVIPVYHPAAGLRNPENMLRVLAGFKTVGDVLKGKREFSHVEDDFPDGGVYVELTDPDEVTALLEAYPDLVAIDTESCADKPWCLSFSVVPGTACVIMAESAHALQALADHVSNPDCLVLIHNALYDIPVLAEMGVHPANYRDTMVMAYLLQSEPQGLKPLAYRYCGMLMSTYSEMVAPATFIKAVKYLTRALERKWPDPEPVLEWVKGIPKVRRPQSITKKINKILKEIATKDADPWDRWHKIEEEAGRGMVEDVHGPMPPGYLSDINLDDAIQYSARDADATLRVYPYLLELIRAYELEDVLDRDMRMMPMASDMMIAGMPIDPVKFAELSEYFGTQMRELHGQIESVAGAPINPGSDDQIRTLLFDKLKLLPPGNKRTATGKVSTNDKILARLADQHFVVQWVRDYRAYKKLKTTYADPVPKLADTNNRVHPTIRITRVATGRLSTSTPNLMAQPVRSLEGRKIRDCYVAAPGCYIVSSDYSQIEMRIAADDSQDAAMCRMFRDGLDIHAQTASTMFGIPVDQLDEMAHRYPAKRIGFGVLYGLTAEGLQRELLAAGLPESEWPVATCAELIREWFRIYSGIADYMRGVRQHALRYGYVRDRWGRIRFVPGAKSANDRDREEALRQAGNAPVQMGAQGVIKEAMARLVPVYRQYQREGHVWRPLIQIHDDIVQEIHEDILPVAMALTKSIMESAVEMSVPVLVDQKIGRSWGTLEKYKL